MKQRSYEEQYRVGAEFAKEVQQGLLEGKSFLECFDCGFQRFYKHPEQFRNGFV